MKTSASVTPRAAQESAGLPRLGPRWGLRAKHALLALLAAGFLVGVGGLTGAFARRLDPAHQTSVPLLVLAYLVITACLIAFFFGGVAGLTAVGLLLTGKEWRGPGVRVTYRCPYWHCQAYLSAWQSPGIGEYARCPRCRSIIKGDDRWW